ncbi:hypothetical protein V565_185730 [Rhizoctonia solani 123E]|uniref:Uncharacterized protein n=1 Tax=Rhizoctonia solani 123E TaxID=1423351 RepID=A0A074RMW8_9AGAM|nr:hypothetical protein V565_185730 [Rhizoctonia solani 123E]
MLAMIIQGDTITAKDEILGKESRVALVKSIDTPGSFYSSFNSTSSTSSSVLHTRSLFFKGSSHRLAYDRISQDFRGQALSNHVRAARCQLFNEQKPRIFLEPDSLLLTAHPG